MADLIILSEIPLLPIDLDVSCNSIVCHSSSLLAVAMYHLVLYISELYLVCTLLYY